MARMCVVISQGQSANPAKRQLEEDLVTQLLLTRGVEVTVIPHLYDLDPQGTGMLALKGIRGDMIVASWLYPRAARWILNQNGVLGQEGVTLLKGADDADDEESEEEQAAEDTSDLEDTESPDATTLAAAIPARRIYCLDLKASAQATPFVEEIRRIMGESSVQTVNLLGWIGGTPSQGALDRYLHPAPGNVHASPPVVNGNGGLPIVPFTANGDAGQGEASLNRLDESTNRRWYPVIDYSRCTNCMECLDFCLFGVYGVDGAEKILVEQPDSCRKGCPACSRVCPENAIIFPQHKTPAIAGSADGLAGGFEIDLSRLFGAPDAMETAVQERDVELVAAGRDAVGVSVGMPKRQEGKEQAPKDQLDRLMDQLDDLDL